MQARYLVERQDGDVYAMVLGDDNPHRKAIIEQLVNSDSSLSRYLERIESMDDDDDYEYDEDEDIEILIDDESSLDELPPEDRPRDDTPLPDGPVDSEALMEEVEQFLRSQGDD